MEMKLSEAVRMGSQWADCHGPVIEPDGSCCAIGGVIRAIGKDKDWRYHYGFGYMPATLSKVFPILDTVVQLPADCPPCFRAGHEFQLNTAIIQLFEGARWSKKAIAEWVETIENKLEEKAGDNREATSGEETALPVVPLEMPHSTPAEVS